MQKALQTPQPHNFPSRRFPIAQKENLRRAPMLQSGMRKGFPWATRQAVLFRPLPYEVLGGKSPTDAAAGGGEGHSPAFGRH